tara:strand:- start:650 stop:832 length:183 start_codon:yes stop_codon:yes gene_type:complete
MRDTKLLQSHSAKLMREAKEKELNRVLRKEVNTGANGTQEYVIKKGANTGKIAKGFQKRQ